MQLAMILFRQHQVKSNIHGSRSYAGMLEPQRTLALTADFSILDDGLRIVLRDTVTFAVHNTKIILCRSVTVFGSLAVSGHS